MSMLIIDIDSWITEFSACERLSSEIQSQLLLRDNEKRRDEYSRISGIIRVRLRQFTSEVEQLRKKLILADKLTVEEEERRHRQIEQLQTKKIHLQKQFTNVNRIDTLQGPSQRSPWDDDEDDTMLDTNNYSVEQLRQQQTKILEDQNQGLDILSAVISRQKNIAMKIGDEVDIQNDIIDVLGDQMENTDSRINNETKHIELVSKKDATCGYYFVMGLLFVAIIIVTLV